MDWPRARCTRLDGPSFSDGGAWSLDDRYFVTEHCRDQHRVVVVEAARHRSANVQVPLQYVTKVQWAGDAGHLVLEGRARGWPAAEGLYTFDLETGKCRLLAAGASMLLSASPYWGDGLLFQTPATTPGPSDWTAARSRFFVRSAGGAQREILPHCFVRSVAPSRDGGRLAALCLPEAAAEQPPMHDERGYTLRLYALYAVDRPSTPRGWKVCSGRFVEGSLRWSAEGRRLLANVKPPGATGEFGIAIVDMHRGDVTSPRDVHGNTLWGDWPQWADGDRRILYGRFVGPYRYEIWSYDIGSRTTKRVYPF